MGVAPWRGLTEGEGRGKGRQGKGSRGKGNETGSGGRKRGDDRMFGIVACGGVQRALSSVVCYTCMDGR